MVNVIQILSPSVAKTLLSIYILLVFHHYTLLYIILTQVMATRRTTRSTEEPSQDITNIMNSISLKLDTINASLQQLINGQNINNTKNGETHQTIASSIYRIQENTVEVVSETKKAEVRREAHKQRRSIQSMWQSQINKRKQQFWQSTNCENTSIIYETWLNKDKKIIPKKFLMKFIPNENEAEKRVRMNSTINQFQAEINLLKIRADRHYAKYKEIDREMLNFLKNHGEGDLLTELERLWAQECDSEERKSQKRWESKQKWLEQYEEEFNNEVLFEVH